MARSIKKLLALLLLSTQAFAGLPPTTSQDSTDTSNVTTFNYQFPNFTGTHTGTTLSLGINSVAGGGTGLATTSQNFVFVGPASGSGAPTWRLLAAGDIPSLASTYLSVSNNLSDVASKTTSFNNISPITTLGDTIYGGAAGTGSRLAGNTNNIKMFYSQQGTGVVSTAPAWSTIAAANLSGITNTQLSGTAGITNANLATMAANTVKANVTGGSATPTDVAETSAATASTFMVRDSNANALINNVTENQTSTATAAGTTTLTVASSGTQIFTGSTTQTLILPAATTLSLNQGFYISDQSTGSITIETNGGATLLTLASGSHVLLQVTSIATSAGTWDQNVTGVSGSSVGHGVVVFTSGTSLTLPSTINAATQFEFILVGGGGGGGGAGAVGTVMAGGGGSAGVCDIFVTGLTASGTINYTIGAAGSGATAGANAGGNGGNSTVVIGGTTFTAGLGTGGPSSASTFVNGGAGGTTTNCNSSPSYGITGQMGQGIANPAAQEMSGFGGSTPLGLGMGGASQAATGAGFAGTGWGAGGSGGCDRASTGEAGGVATQGVLIMKYWN